METMLSQDIKSEHYHDARKHGLVWVLLNKMLHLIVLVYSLFGMIRFKVKFIHAVKLIESIRIFIIIHSWYLTIKFGIIAVCLYFFNVELETHSISFIQLNCSLETDIFAAVGPTDLETTTKGVQVEHHKYLTVVRLARVLNVIGGPFKLLGNRATLMYGFYSIAIFIMLAIFPIELIYLDIGFNYIRFVLNDTSCMKELYANKQKYLDRLNLWSRTQNNSMMTLSTKKTINQKNLRCTYARDCQELAPNVSNVSMALQTDSHAQNKLKGELKRLEPIDLIDVEYDRLFGDNHDDSDHIKEKFGAPIKSLRRSLSNSHQDKPTYCVKVATENLRKFKPHARSETWFKSSMVVYPIFIFYYFATLTIVIGSISLFFKRSLEDVSSDCAKRLNDDKLDLFKNWSILDHLIFYETQYSVFALSCASSFYCSYYFGTIIELCVWLQEISQQLTLCKIVLELSTDDSTARLVAPHSTTKDAVNLANSLYSTHNLPDDCCNKFGGIQNLWTHIKMRRKPQSERLKSLELMATRLLSTKQTLLRATYINMNLFFDELNDTRFMTQVMLGRTTQIVFGFAIMVAVTRSQFESNIIYLTILLAACLAILNLYLICAAFVNSSINKLLPQIHGLISISAITGTDHDLLEFWLRHIQAYGTDKDAMSYRIYGYKITWSSILNFNGAVSSAYLFTIY